MFKKVDKNEVRKAKHSRIRHTLKGTADMPRLNVYRSTNEIYAQIIDDKAGKTLCSASSKDKALAKAVEGKTKVDAAFEVGKAVAEKAVKAYEKSLERQLEAQRERRFAQREARNRRIENHKKRIKFVPDKKEEKVICPRCKALLGPKPKQCPHCGYKFPKK